MITDQIQDAIHDLVSIIDCPTQLAFICIQLNKYCETQPSSIHYTFSKQEIYIVRSVSRDSENNQSAGNNNKP